MDAISEIVHEDSRPVFPTALRVVRMTLEPRGRGCFVFRRARNEREFDEIRVWASRTEWVTDGCEPQAIIRCADQAAALDEIVASSGWIDALLTRAKVDSDRGEVAAQLRAAAALLLRGTL